MAAERMTFVEYLRSRNIDESTPGAEGILFEIMSAVTATDYRMLSLVAADLPELVDLFERLWYDYETELDRQNYEAELECI